jgi:hypothetical protein
VGVHDNISYDKFPKQSPYEKVWVAFNYEFDHDAPGTIVRDDAESPYVTIIKLDDGRFILGTECQYSLRI